MRLGRDSRAHNMCSDICLYCNIPSARAAGDNGKQLMAESGASRLESISRGIAVSAIVVGILAAFGWIFDIEFLRNVYAELPATRMNEGIAMVLGGFSLWMTGGKPLRWER